MSLCLGQLRFLADQVQRWVKRAIDRTRDTRDTLPGRVAERVAATCGRNAFDANRGTALSRRDLSDAFIGLCVHARRSDERECKIRESPGGGVHGQVPSIG